MLEWITLQEYSNKYKVSISTLRRRIKTEDLACVLKEGRYLLEDSEENLKIKEKDFTSYKEFHAILEKKEQEIIKLQNELEDTKQFTHLLELEKKELEDILKKSSFLNPKPSL